ncbi:MAG: PadR family transcriptional regulator [Blastochloris sp.]|nr:PadR family transcriptional regulator [Blastochloris sp.]
MLKYILLGFLNYSPMTGYDLKRIIDHSTAHFWHAYHSQIYTTLARMEDEGLLTSETDDSDDKLSRRVYTITPTGQAALAAWQRQPLTSLPHGKNELLVRLFFSADRKTEEVLDELRIQRRLHQQQLELYNHIYLDDYLNEAPPLSSRM